MSNTQTIAHSIAASMNIDKFVSILLYSSAVLTPLEITFQTFTQTHGKKRITIMYFSTLKPHLIQSIVYYKVLL